MFTWAFRLARSNVPKAKQSMNYQSLIINQDWDATLMKDPPPENSTTDTDTQHPLTYGIGQPHIFGRVDNRRIPILRQN